MVERVETWMKWAISNEHTWSLRSWWWVGANALTRLECGGWPWHDGVIAAHWQGVYPGQDYVKTNFPAYNTCPFFVLETCNVKANHSHHILYLCGWRCPPSPWKTWSGRCRALSRAPGPPGPGSGPSFWPGTSLAFRDSAPAPPPSGHGAPPARCCCWPWSHVWPQSAHSHRRAEGEKIFMCCLWDTKLTLCF